MRTYKVNSLERGLAILRVVREGDGPVRNQDVVARTGLPKATASRLMHTLTAMGYLRRIDQGSYVLGEMSARAGRAMIEGLMLERYTPYFDELLAKTGAFACLEVRIAGNMVPVFRWSTEGAALLTSGRCKGKALIDSLTGTCFDFFFGDLAKADSPAVGVTVKQLSRVNWGHQWNEPTSQLFAFTGIRHRSVGCFVLLACMPQPDHPSVDRLESIEAQLLRAAGAISRESFELNGDENGDTFA